MGIERKSPAVPGSLQLQPRESGTYFCRIKERYGAFSLCADVSYFLCYMGGEGAAVHRLRGFLFISFYVFMQYHNPHIGSVVKRQFRRCLTKPHSKPFSILPTIISKHCLLLMVTRGLASQSRNLFIYLK